ncbi:MAG: zeta toxin family protein [Burkholderiales bacterium]|nr:zeta toxin family protein [Burkholderiales bacterium]
MAKAATPPQFHGGIFVLAGCNGAGKSSIGGAALLAHGVQFYNPDEAACKIAAANAGLDPPPTTGEVNAAAWNQGRRLLERSIAQHLDFAFETTLGGQTMTELLIRAASQGLAVNVWFAGLASAELHIQRVRQRVARGGHDIPREKIVERYDGARKNLIRLLPQLASVRVYDNTVEAAPDQGLTPSPRLLLYCVERKIVAPVPLPKLLTNTPEWAKPIVAAALDLHLKRR